MSAPKTIKLQDDNGTVCDVHVSNIVIIHPPLYEGGQLKTPINVQLAGKYEGAYDLENVLNLQLADFDGNFNDLAEELGFPLFTDALDAANSIYSGKKCAINPARVQSVSGGDSGLRTIHLDCKRARFFLAKENAVDIAKKLGWSQITIKAGFDEAAEAEGTASPGMSRQANHHWAPEL